jgi:cytochrome c553
MRLTRSTLIFSVLAIAVVGAVFTCVAISAAGAGPSAELIKRGEYLVAVTGCHDCHSPKADAQMTPDLNRLLSGRPTTTAPPLKADREIRASLDLTAWSGPWGNSYEANLTPDLETGLGARYSKAAFIKTMRTGQKPEGEPLLPPMPWPAFRNMTDEDLGAIYAYLTTLKPVQNFVRAAPKLAAN